MQEFLFFTSENQKADIAIHVTKTQDLHLDCNEILSHREMQKYEAFKTEIGKIEYLLGRYSAKQAYWHLNKNSTDLKTIEILNGVFGQPFFTHNSKFDISITHSKNIAGATVFDRRFLMGIDIEEINKSKIEFLKTMTLHKEVETFSIQNEFVWIISWCLKEALSKAIKVGLTIPLNLLEIEIMNEIEFGENIFECKFKNFPQYKGFARVKGVYVIALVYPKQLFIGVQE